MIRNLHFSDFLKLGRLHEANVGLDILGALVIPHSLRGAAISQRLPVPVQSFNSSIYIYEQPEGKPCAFLQARARQRRDEWDILALGTIGELPQPQYEHLENSDQTREADNTPDLLQIEFQTEDATVALIRPATDNVNTADINLGNFAYNEEAGQAEIGEDNNLDSLPVVQTEIEDEGGWPSISEAEVAWAKLLEHLIIDAGERGVLRVYARLMEDSPEFDLFSQTGFHTFAHENLYHLNYKTTVEKSGETKLRPQRNRDLFPIDQLYRAVTPNQVQYAEAPNSSSRSWALSRNYFPRPLKEQGFVWEENDKVIAYLRLLSHRNRALLSVMCLDNQREILPEVVRFGLSLIKAGEDVQVYCAVREYQAEQENVLESLGFEYFGKQAVMVKHIVQYIKNAERSLAHVRDHKLELAHSVIHRSTRQTIIAKKYTI